MKKFDKVIATLIVVYLVISIGLPFLLQVMNSKSSSEYKVEINRINSGLVENGSFTEPDLTSYKFIKAVIVISILFYVRNSILKPFNTLSEMPMELSKGNLCCGQALL